MKGCPLLVICLTVLACERELPAPPPAVPVRTEVARRRSFTPSLTLLGVIRAAQAIPLTAQQRGQVRYPARFANGLQTGARVSRGELIAEIENADVESGRTEARLQRDAATADFERAERSFKLGVISSAEYAQRRANAALAAERFNAAVKRVAALRVVAPASGTLVVTKIYPPGTVVDASTTLAEVATQGAPMVESAVAASQHALLRPGLPVTFTSRGAPAWHGSGRISEVAAVIAETGTARVVAIIAPNATVPPPGTGVEVNVQLASSGAVLTVPEDAIVAGTDGPALFIAAIPEGGKDRFRVKRVPVAVGGRANGRVEISSGLHDGDRVVVSGADALGDDSIAVEVNDKATP